MKRRHAHTPPVLAPTAYGCAAAVLGGALYLAAVQTGSDACMAGALAILLSHIVSLGVALAAFLDEKWRGKVERTGTAARTVHAIARAATNRRERITYNRIDQMGRVAATLTLEQPPRERGVYQARSRLVSTTGPLWLWRSNARTTMDGEFLRPPAAIDMDGAAGAAMLAQDGTGAQVTSELDTSMVRPYQRGDQMNAIAWRQTAHHGRLMSYERRRIAHARVLVVPDTSSATTPADADALAAHTLAAWNTIRRSRRAGCVQAHVSLADGEVQLDDDASVSRYCTALYHQSPHGAPDARARAQRAIDTAHAMHAGQIILITVNENSPMARALASSDLAHTVTAIEAKAKAQDEDGHASASTGASANTAPAQSHPIARTLHGALIGAATFYPLLLLVQTMGKMFSSGEWNMVAPYAFGLVCAEAALMEALPPSSAANTRRTPKPRRFPITAAQAARIALFAATTVALLALGAVAARQTLNQRVDFALFKQIYEHPAMLGSLQASGPIAAAINILTIGVGTLYYGQWAPVNVSFVGDAALVIIWCAIAMALRPLLLSRRARPLVAVTPLIAQAAAFLLMGDAAHLPQAGAAILCGLILAALSHAPKSARRADAPKTKGALVHIITSASIASMVAISAATIAPAAISLSPASPLEIIPQQGIFSNGAINPVLDLKRDLTRPGKSIALTYRADVAQTGASGGATQTYGPLYLRLATLGSFNSGTWMAGQDAATGVALDETSPALSAFADAERLNSAAIGEVQTVQATISLDNVSSAYLPVPSNSFNVTLADAMDDAGEQERDNARAAMDKLTWSQDGGAGARDGSNVPRGFSYSATCAYQAPISEPDQLDQIASIASRLNAQVVAQENGDIGALSQGQPDRSYLYLDQALPDELQEFVDTARANGIAEAPAIRRDADTSLNADGLSPRQVAQIAAMRYLVDYFANGGFTYSLDAPDGNGSSNLQVIANLLQERRGYCVHYASALAVLGRALGMSTRLVLGYRANASGAATTLENGVETVTYQATNHDLHAWTEAFIDNVGWVSFDVTPSTGQSDPTPGAPVDAEANHPADQADDQDTPNVSDTNSSDSDAPFAGEDGDRASSGDPSFLSAIADALTSLANKLAGALPYICGALVAFIAALSPALLRRTRKSRRMHAVRHTSDDSAHAIASAWSEATDAALDAGIVWSPSDTEEDIARAIAGALEDETAATALLQINRAICAMRYSDGNSATRIASELPALLDSVLAAIEAHARSADNARGVMARALRLLAPASLFARQHIRQR